MTNTKYEEFIASKRISAPEVGFELSRQSIKRPLFPFQRDIVLWALKKGRAAIFAGCGMGKTLIQLEWAFQIWAKTLQDVLILAPLAVAQQTKREAEKFGIATWICNSQADVEPGINITNYEKLQHFDSSKFGAIVCDESSIMKSFEGQTRKAINTFAKKIKLRLGCTATPSPNDLIEIINHAEFLDVMNGKEVIALFFKQDGNTTHKWKLRDHAKKEFFRWLASWAVALEKPSDLGYSDEGFVLPPLRIEQITVDSTPAEGMLFAVEAKTLRERRSAKNDSLEARVAEVARKVHAEPDEPWLIWCNQHNEADALRKAIPDAVEVRGSDKPKKKEQALLDFTEGRIKRLITKPSIAGFGLNWQHCARQAFVGLSDSWEELYQATRRVWRYGQKREVVCYHVASEAEGSILANLRRKEEQYAELMTQLVAAMREQSIKQLGKTQRTKRNEAEYKEETAVGDGWTLRLGDSVEIVQRLKPESVGLWMFSPPFPGMYAYSNSARDLGNCESIAQMIDHFRFLLPGMLRATMPGRLAAVHLCQLTAMKSRDGYIGVKDYRGKVIDLFESEGWIYGGEATIDKNPQIQATRNKERGLLFKSLANDASVLRPALADYLLLFRKPGQNPRPIRAGRSERYNNPNGWLSEAEWCEMAAPVWYRHVAREGKTAEAQPHYPSLRQVTRHYRTKVDGLVEYNGIMETDVLNATMAKEPEDARHLCPLQLAVCERAINLWSAPGDLVGSPFNGIGSAGVIALKLRRDYLGIELKRSYFKTSIENFKRAIKERDEAEQERLPLIAAMGA